MSSSGYLTKEGHRRMQAVLARHVIRLLFSCGIPIGICYASRPIPSIVSFGLILIVAGATMLSLNKYREERDAVYRDFITRD